MQRLVSTSTDNERIDEGSILSIPTPFTRIKGKENDDDGRSGCPVRWLQGYRRLQSVDLVLERKAMSAFKTYSQILASLSPEDRRKYYEPEAPLDRRVPVGEVVWDASIGRHVVVR